MQWAFRGRKCQRNGVNCPDFISREQNRWNRDSLYPQYLSHPVHKKNKSYHTSTYTEHPVISYLKVLLRVVFNSTHLLLLTDSSKELHFYVFQLKECDLLQHDMFGHNCQQHVIKKLKSESTLEADPKRLYTFQQCCMFSEPCNSVSEKRLIQIF